MTQGGSHKHQIYEKIPSQSFHSLSLFNDVGEWGRKKSNCGKRRGQKYHHASNILFERPVINVINVITFILIYRYVENGKMLTSSVIS